MNKNKIARISKRILLTCSMFLAFQSLVQSITVNSISELKTYLDDDNVEVTMAPGTYTITANNADFTTVGSSPYTSAVLFYVEGSNSTFDFTGVTINIETAALQTVSGVMDIWEMNVVGNNTTLKNLTMVDLGSVYDKPSKRATNIVIDGSGNTIEGFNMTIKGSQPYGYGDAFGKGSDNIISHTKHCGILVRGDSPYVKNCTLNHMAYGHAIFLQAAEDAVIEGCTIIGEVRSTDDMLAEEGTGSAADKVDFMGIWGYRLPPGFMMSTGEEGIRAYTAGGTVIDGVSYSRNTTNVTVRNCTIKFMRFGVNLGHASGTRIATGCKTIGCELGISADDMTGSSVDISYGPLGVGGANNETKDITITQLLEPYNGAGRAAYICGTGNDITLRCEQTNVDQSLKIVVSGGYNTIGFQPGTKFDYQNIYNASNNNIKNLTLFPMVLGEESSNNVVVSGGMVTDLGTNNKITRINLSALNIEAEDFASMDGVTTEATTDEGGGDHVNSIDAGDWMEYEIDVPYSGSYSIDYRVGGASSDGDFTLSSNGIDLEQITFSEIGEPWKTVRSVTPLFFNKGTQTIRLTANSAGWVMNKMSFMLECIETPIVPYITRFNARGEAQSKEESSTLEILPGNTAALAPEPALGGMWSWVGPNGFTSDERVVTFTSIQKSQEGTYSVVYTNPCGLETTDTFNVSVLDSWYVEAEDFTLMSGIEIESTNDVSGDKNITSILSEDWVEYEIDIPFSALYSFSYRVASENSSSEFEVSVDEESVENITFNSTGGAQKWETVNSSSNFYLKAGVNKLRINSNSNNWNLNWIKIIGLQSVDPCSLPFEDDGFRIYNTTLNWTSGAMDISCEEELDIHVTLQSLLNFADGDSLNIYYKLDGGKKVAIAQIAGKVTTPIVSATQLAGKTLEILVESTVGPLGIYDINNILVVKSNDPFARIQAEDYDDGNGPKAESTSDTGGGENMGFIVNGSWLMYKNIYLSEVGGIKMRAASAMSGGSVEIRLNSETGKKIGGFAIPNTGGWQKWVTLSGELDDVSGFYDVYLVFSSSSSYVGNINWFEFTPKEEPNSTIEVNAINEEIKLYPNPVSHTLYFKTDKENSKSVDIYDITGVKIISSQLRSSENSIDVSGLLPGVYWVLIKNGNNISTKKIIKI